MNRLLIDVGNTNICVAVFSEDEALFVKRLETHEKWNQVSFSEALRQSFLEYVIAPESVSGAILSSVVPELNCRRFRCRSGSRTGRFLVGTGWLICLRRGRSIISRQSSMILDPAARCQHWQETENLSEG